MKRRARHPSATTARWCGLPASHARHSLLPLMIQPHAMRKPCHALLCHAMPPPCHIMSHQLPLPCLPSMLAGVNRERRGPHAGTPQCYWLIGAHGVAWCPSSKCTWRV